MGKHESPEWMDEVLEREEITDWEELYEILGTTREEFWQEFWRQRKDEFDIMQEIHQARLEEFEERPRYASVVDAVPEDKRLGVVDVDARRGLVKVPIKRDDGVVQSYWVKPESLAGYRLAKKRLYYWR